GHEPSRSPPAWSFNKALPARRQRFLLTSSVVTFRSGIGLESLAEYDLRRRHFRGGLPRHRLCYSFRAMISCGRCPAGTQDVQQELPGKFAAFMLYHFVG